MKVAVCVDHNRASKEALNEAIEFSTLVDADLTLLHSVEENVQNDENGLVQESESTAMDRGEELLEELQERAYESELSVETELIAGNGGTINDILDYANDNGVDYMFIGHRGLQGKHEELFGSFAKDMISKSEVPVVVV